MWTVHGLGKMRDKVKDVSVRKGIMSEFVTLDGVMEDPGGAEGFEHCSKREFDRYTKGQMGRKVSL